jgi:hypothetical protein
VESRHRDDHFDADDGDKDSDRGKAAEDASTDLEIDEHLEHTC